MRPMLDLRSLHQPYLARTVICSLLSWAFACILSCLAWLCRAERELQGEEELEKLMRRVKAT